jgi:hypothetical protein
MRKLARTRGATREGLAEQTRTGLARLRFCKEVRPTRRCVARPAIVDPVGGTTLPPPVLRKRKSIATAATFGRREAPVLRMVIQKFCEHEKTVLLGPRIVGRWFLKIARKSLRRARVLLLTRRNAVPRKSWWILQNQRNGVLELLGIPCLLAKKKRIL